MSYGKPVYKPKRHRKSRTERLMFKIIGIFFYWLTIIALVVWLYLITL